MGCMGKKILKMLAGLAILGITLNYIVFDVWTVIGLYLLLAGLAPFLCKCECCGGCEMPGKKKR